MEIIPNWHPIFVHFTVALFTLAVGLYLAVFFIKDEDLKSQCFTVARWNLWIGMAITILTLITGWLAYNSVAHDEPSHAAMTDHRNWALVTASVFALLTGWSVFQYRKVKAPSVTLLLSLIVGSALLGSTAWRGGEVVYRYGLGVMSLPKVEAAGGDGHSHGAEGHAKIETAVIVKQNSAKKMEESSSHDDHSN
jgi:uncharacterized membrane protein